MATQTEIALTGLESDLNLLIPAFVNEFNVEAVSRWHPVEDEPRFTVYLSLGSAP